MTQTAVRWLLGLLFVLTSQAMESEPHAEDVYDDQWPEHPIDDEQARRSREAFATMNVNARELPAEEKQRIQKKSDQRSQPDQRQQRNDRWDALDDSPTNSRQKGQQRSQHDQRNYRWRQQRSRQGQHFGGLQKLWGALPEPHTTAEAILDQLQEDKDYRERFVKAAIGGMKDRTSSLQIGLQGQYLINLDAFLSDNKELANVPICTKGVSIGWTPLEYAVFITGAPDAVRILLRHGAKLTTEHYLAKHFTGTTAIARAKTLVAHCLKEGRGIKKARIQAGFIRDIAKHIVENPTEFSEEEIAQAEESKNWKAKIYIRNGRHHLL